ncbi:MAG TPA: TaqI-like C-terminal specificity domain-containing protein, partial [Longimicrobiaceae bacterium]|nr:TaqI-like C-terminal specificity domain-containing protein [Longimicrobiaceae bacterium]
IERTLLDKHVLFTGSGNSDLTAIWDRVYARSVKLDSIAFVNFGKQLRDRKKHPTDVIEVAGVDEIEGAYRACYNGRDIARYQLTWGHLACLDDPVARSGGCWDSDRHDTTGKLLTRQIGRHPEFALDTAGYQCLNTIFMINFRSEAKVDPRFVLGLLNSRLTRAIWLDRFYDKRRTFPKIKGTYLKELPVYALDRSESADIARHDRMVSLVVRMLALHEQYASAKIGHDKTLIGRQIEATDRQIDRLVYELYALTEQEIKLIEKA